MRVQSSVALFTFRRLSAQFLNRIVLTSIVVTGLLAGLFCIPVASATASLSSSSAGSSFQQQQLNSIQKKINENKFTEALRLTQTMLNDNPQQPGAQFMRALALAGLGKLDEAVSGYELILKSKADIKPFIPEIYNNLATLYAKQGKLDLAKKTLEKGMATNQKYKTLYDNLSAVYVEMARGAYSKALKLGVQAKSVRLKTLPLSLEKQLAKADVTNHVALVREPKKSVFDAKIKASGSSTIKPEDPVTKMIPAVTAANPVTNPQNKKSASSVKQGDERKKAAAGINKDEVKSALYGWAAAWSAQAVDLYLSFYGKEFKPKNLSRKVWAVQRRIRLTKPRWVNVRLKDMEIKVASAANDKAIVNLVQDYRADNYRDKTKKQFVMKRTSDGWRILSEKSLAVIR